MQFFIIEVQIISFSKRIKKIIVRKIQVDFVLLTIDFVFVDFVNLLVNSVKLIAPYPATFCFFVYVSMPLK